MPQTATQAWVPHIGSYRRRMPVSLARMYENALDWEHLPWLHSSSFKSIDCIEAGDWGWRAKAVLADTDPSLLASAGIWKQAFKQSLRHQPLRLLRFVGGLAQQSLAAKRGGAEVLLELRLDRKRQRWITKTLAGPGQGTEIWTHVLVHGEQDIEVLVDFFVPNIPQPMAAPLSHYYQTLYHRLYDEDQGMMETRQQGLDAKQTRQAKQQRQDKNADRLELGPVASLKTQLPLTINFGGRDWCLREHQGELVIYQKLCPHMLGPLSEGQTTQAGAVRCPWHGYEFSLSSGENLTGQRCKLAKPPHIRIQDEQVTVEL